MNPDDFAQKINIEFDDKLLLSTVFIHRSYLNEHRKLDIEHNERLEFLGDAVLELCVTEYLFKNFNKPEGEMTNWRSALVKGESLSCEAKKLGINDLLKTSRGEAKNRGKARDLILANAFEALIGAIYLDRGFETVLNFVIDHVCYKLDDILKKGLQYDAKSKFQELSQDILGITPTYELKSESGPDHNKTFIMSAYLDKLNVGQGEGKSKQKSQTEAAESALKKWDEIVKKFGS